MCKTHLSGAFYYVTSIHTHLQLITEALWLYLNIRHLLLLTVSVITHLKGQ